MNGLLWEAILLETGSFESTVDCVEEKLARIRSIMSNKVVQVMTAQGYERSRIEEHNSN